VSKYSVTPSIECIRESTNDQSDLSNLNQRIDQPIAFIRSVERIVPLHQWTL